MDYHTRQSVNKILIRKQAREDADHVLPKLDRRALELIDQRGPPVHDGKHVFKIR